MNRWRVDWADYDGIGLSHAHVGDALAEVFVRFSRAVVVRGRVGEMVAWASEKARRAGHKSGVVAHIRRVEITS